MDRPIPEHLLKTKRGEAVTFLEAISEALERLSGNKPKVAEELGISLKTLYNKLNQASALEKSA